MSRRNDYLDCKVYVGGLPSDATSEEIENAFRRYGRIRKVWVARRPPGFAFVEYEDNRDAEDAVRGLDGSRICGVKARVELSNGKRRREGGGGFGGGRSGDRGDRGDRGDAATRAPARVLLDVEATLARLPRRTANRRDTRTLRPAGAEALL